MLNKLSMSVKNMEIASSTPKSIDFAQTIVTDDWKRVTEGAKFKVIRTVQ